MKISRLLSATALAGSLLCVPAVAWAQDEAPAAAQSDDTADDEADEDTGPIVVTGSRIARPTLDSTVPVTSVDVGDLTNQGDISLGDALNDLPSLRSTYSAGNSTRFIGTAGLNLLDLRGLGISRTLVLVNGKRHITASPGDYLVDVNTIPVDLLERVDVVTGGNSAVYGSDAVAGVVNFVLKRDYDGLSLRGQGGISQDKDRGTFFIAGTWGTNFADGRGNIAVAAEYAHANALYFKDRDSLTGAYSGRCQFNTAELQGAGNPGNENAPSASDGVPDNQFFCGVVNANIANGGLVSPNASATTTSTVFCGGGGVSTLTPAQQAARCLPSNQPRIFSFNGQGDLVQSIPTTDFRPFGSGNAIVPDPSLLSTLRDTGQLAAGVNRYAINVLAHFDVSDAFKPFIEAKFVRVDANQEGQPSFFQGGLLGTFSCSNPFLKPGSLAVLQSLGRCASPAGTFALSRFNVDFGGRGEDHRRETVRIVGGFEGTFNDDWKYEFSFNYGHLKTHMDSLNNLVLTDEAGNFDGYLLAYDAVLAPANFGGTNFATNAAGQKVICAVNATTNVRPDCIPLNLFGTNQADPRALAFSNTTATRDEWAEEMNAVFYLSGDSSQWFELPGGPVGFALGAEWRQEKASSEYDTLTAAGGTFLNAIAPFKPPVLRTKEAFGEIRIPLVANAPFFKELTVEGAARVSDYNSSAGTTWAYNVGGIWAPSSDFRFRANYSKSVRAPTQSDLYSTISQNFAQVTDPCDALQIGNGPNRAARCAEAGVPVGFVNLPARQSSTSFQSGGNPNLTVETGKSLTVGGVFTPSFAPGFSMTVDYYRINVDRLIAAPSLQAVLNLCYDSTLPFAQNPYCSVTATDPTGLYPRQPGGLFALPYAGVSTGVNFAGQKASGIDADFQYRRRFANGHRVTVRGIGTWVLNRTNYTNIIDPRVPDRIKGELGDPEFTANLYANYDFGFVDVSYTLRFIGKQTIGTYEAQHSFTGVCPASGTIAGTSTTCTPNELTTLPPANADQFPVVWYPEVFYHNVRLNFDIDSKYSFYIGADNVTNKKPPYGLLGTAGGDPFDTFGRYMYAGFKAEF